MKTLKKNWLWIAGIVIAVYYLFFSKSAPLANTTAMNTTVASPVPNNVTTISVSPSSQLTGLISDLTDVYDNYIG